MLEWESFVKTVTKLKKKPMVTFLKSPKIKMERAENRISMPDDLNLSQEINKIERGRFKSIKKNRILIDLKIDLHGFTVREAEGRIEKFIQNAYLENKRYLLVITGKGKAEDGGILRKNLTNWLNLPSIRPLILSYSHAASKDGGEGAYYIILRKKK